MDEIPQGMQNLLLMASEDRRLRDALLDDREATLERCGVILTESERQVMLAIPPHRLAQMIEHMGVAQPERREFLRVGAAALMALLTGGALLAAASPSLAAPSGDRSPGTGPDPSSAPKRPPKPSPSPHPYPPINRGTATDRPKKPTPKPTPPPTGTGIRPDIPPPK